MAAQPIGIEAIDKLEAAATSASMDARRAMTCTMFVARGVPNIVDEKLSGLNTTFT